MVSASRAARNRRTVANVIALGQGGGVLPALPALPLAAGSRMVFHGDSQMQFSHEALRNLLNSGTLDELGVSSLGHGLIAQAHSIDPRIDISTWFDAADPWYNSGAGNGARRFQGANQGIAGDHMDWDGSNNSITGGGILPRLDYTLAKGGQLVILEGGTNSLSTGDVAGSSTPATAAYIIAKLDAALRKIRAAGKWAILITIWPRSDFTVANGKETARLAVNDWIRAQNGRGGLVGISDAEAVLAPGGVIDDTMFQVDAGQRIHLSPKGAYIVARDYLVPLIAQAVAAGSAFNQDGTVNSLLPSALYQLTGSGGTKAGGTGAVSDNCRIARTRGAGSFAAVKEAATGFTKQVFTFTSSGSDTIANGFDFSLPAITAANIQGGVLPAAGTWLRAHLFYEITAAADATSITLLTLKLTDSVAAADRAAVRALYDSFAGYGLLPHAGPTRSGWLSTPPLQIPAGVSFDQINVMASTYIDGRIATTVNPVVKFSKPILRSVADPRVAWGY